MEYGICFILINVNYLTRDKKNKCFHDLISINHYTIFNSNQHRWQWRNVVHITFQKYLKCYSNTSFITVLENFSNTLKYNVLYLDKEKYFDRIYKNKKKVFVTFLSVTENYCDQMIRFKRFTKIIFFIAKYEFYFIFWKYLVGKIRIKCEITNKKK